MATPRKSVKKAAKKSANKSGLVFPVGRIGSMLRKGRFSKRVSRGAAVFLAATLEYLVAETLELSSKTVAKGGKRITPRALTLAIRHDADLGSLLQNVTISRGGVASTGAAKGLDKKAKKSKKAKKAKKSSKSTPKA
jgi:histone H2A